MKDFFMKTVYKLQQFMVGRYGYDQLSKLLLIVYLIVIIAANIVYRFSHVAYIVITIAGFGVLVFSIYRVFSKNIDKRRSENAAWLRYMNKIKSCTALLKNKWKQRKTHKFVKCKACGRVLRLPRHKGKINVDCPHCHNKFIVNTGKKK